MRVNSSNLDAVFKAKPASVDTMQLLGYELIDEIMVDNSGFGSPEEYADTPSQFLNRLRSIVAEHGTVTAKITSAGMFQVYVGLFTKTGTKRARVLASNCYLIDDGAGRRRIRLYDTDIVTDNGDGTLTLDTGGFNTMTTSKRMNQFSNVYVNRKNWVMQCGSTPFKDNRITVKGALTV